MLHTIIILLLKTIPHLVQQNVGLVRSKSAPLFLPSNRSAHGQRPAKNYCMMPDANAMSLNIHLPSAKMSAAAAAVITSTSCADNCGDPYCLETLYIVSTALPIVRATTPCCGPNCSIPADGSHSCVLCGAQVCGICPAANYDKSLPSEPFGRNVICKHHPEYLETRKLQISIRAMTNCSII